MKTAFCPTIFFALFTAFSVGAWAQTAQLTGTVSDASGAAVPGAKVTATNVATGVARSTETNTTGNYLITALLPGSYRVASEIAGFKQMDQGPFTLEVDQVARVDFAMQLGESHETVKVESTAVILDTASTAISSVVENKQVLDLPLNGRDPVNLLALDAGIRIQNGFGGVMTSGGTTQGNAWSGFSFNGGIAGANPMLVEGLALDLAVMNLPSYVPPADATQEFRAQTSTFTAEYGRTTGAVINFSIKSGTNQFHGSAYEYWRNRDLNANNFFQNKAGLPRTAANQNQFGGSVGGPIRKDQIFFFGNFEEYTTRSTTSSTTSVPTDLQKAGNFTQTYTATGAVVTIADPLTVSLQPNGSYTRTPFPGNIVPANRLSTVAKNIAKIYPEPNTAGVAFTNVNNYQGVSTSRNNQQNAVGKFDYNLNSMWKIFGTYARLWDAPVTGNPWPYPINFTRNQTDDRHHATLSATAILRNGLIGEFHTGFARSANVGVPNALGFDIKTLGFPASFADTTEIQGFPGFSVSGITGIGGSGSAGANVAHLNSWAQRGSLTWVKGYHTVKFGADYRVQQMNQYFENAFDPLFNFTNQWTAINPQVLNSASGVPFASFLLGDVSSASAAKSPQFANERKYFAVFIQDDWKVTRNLTVNVGTDYSLEFPITDRYNRKMWFDPTASVPVSQTLGFPVTGGFDFASSSERYPFDLYTHQIGPRIGAAYQVTPKTVIRSAFGIFWIPANLTEVVGGSRASAWELSTQMLTSLDNNITLYNTLDNPFPQGIQNPPGNVNGLSSLLGQPVAANRRFFHTGYMGQWNFNVQREVARGGIFQIGYAGSMGVDLPGLWATQANQLPDQYLSLGSKLSQLVANPYYPLVQSGLITVGALAQPQIQYGQLLRPFPQFDTVFDEGDPWGHSSYHALQMQYKQRLAGGLFTVAYTNSKALGNTEARLDSGGNSSGIMDNNNRKLAKALASYDVPQRLVISYTYPLPFGKGQHWLNASGPASAIVGGWQVNGIYTGQTGLPIAPTSSTNLAGNFNAVTDVYGSFVSNAQPSCNGQNPGINGSSYSRLNQWFNTADFSQPAAYTYGTCGRNLPNVRADHTNSFDMSVFRNFKFGHAERFTVQVRAEFFNALNHVQFASPGATFGNATFGVVSGQGNSPRQGQLAARLQF
jgi:hypothetical protein